MRITSRGLFGVLVLTTTSAISTGLIAQKSQPDLPSYTVVDLGTLTDGQLSQAVSISNDGVVSGWAATPDFTSHATLWYRGSMIDLTKPGLGGANSAAYGVNDWGQASGLAETAKDDPDREDFCGYGTFHTCRPFLWQRGVMTPLPTLGGKNGEAGQINNRGEIAGNVENRTQDYSCPAGVPQQFEEKPVMWRNGRVYELKTFPGDPDGWAFGINESGQVVGASGVCSALNPQTGVYVESHHSLLWDNGRMIDLKGLGGSGSVGPGNIAGAINNRGEVIGTSDLPGDTTFHGFVWTKGAGIKDLNTLKGDFASAALGINDLGEVVGVSFDPTFQFPRAFLRRNGEMMDLNAIAPKSPLYLLFAHGINIRGEIVGFGADKAGNIHAFRAIPCDRKVKRAGD